MGVFGGLIFGPGIFLGFVGSLRDVLGFDFCPHSIIPVTRNPEYPPRGPRYHVLRLGLVTKWQKHCYQHFQFYNIVSCLPGLFPFTLVINRNLFSVVFYYSYVYYNGT